MLSTPAGSVFLPLTLLFWAAVSSHDPLAKEMKPKIWIFTKSITGIKRLFLPTLFHQMGIWDSFGVCWYSCPYGHLCLAGARPFHTVMVGTENQKSRFLLWCLWKQRWLKNVSFPLLFFLDLFGSWERSVEELFCGNWSSTADISLMCQRCKSCQTACKHKPVLTSYQAWMLSSDYGQHNNLYCARYPVSLWKEAHCGQEGCFLCYRAFFLAARQIWQLEVLWN